MRSVVRIEVNDMVIGSAQNGYVREALKLAQEIDEIVNKPMSELEPDELQIMVDDIKRLIQQLEEAVKYGRDLFQEAG